MRVNNFYGTDLDNTNILWLKHHLVKYDNIEYKMGQHIICYVTIINVKINQNINSQND